MKKILKTIRWYFDTGNGLLATLTIIYEIRTNSFKQTQLSKIKNSILIDSFFMVLSSIDVISIGAVLPFLAAITSPDIIFDNVIAKEFFQYFGYAKADELIAPLTIFFIIAVAFSSLFRVFQFILNARISHISGAYIGVKVYKKALAQDYIDHKLGKSNEIKTIIASKIEELIIRTLQLYSNNQFNYVGNIYYIFSFGT